MGASTMLSLLLYVFLVYSLCIPRVVPTHDPEVWSVRTCLIHTKMILKKEGPTSHLSSGFCLIRQNPEPRVWGSAFYGGCETLTGGHLAR